MRVNAKTIKNGLIKPLTRINLPLGTKLILSIELSPQTSLEHFKSVSQKTFGAMKDENWKNLRRNFNKDFTKRLNKLWNVPS